MARIEGVVKLTFALAANSNEPKLVEVVSGPPPLRAAAVDNVKTWRFRNPYTVDRKYETTFTYRLSGRELPGGAIQKLTVSIESFHSVEVVTDAYRVNTNYSSTPSSGTQ